MPPKAHRRNVLIYELVSYVNHITGCYLSNDFKAIEIYIERSRIFIENNVATEESSKYYELVDKYFSELEEWMNESNL